MKRVHAIFVYFTHLTLQHFPFLFVQDSSSHMSSNLFCFTTSGRRRGGTCCTQHVQVWLGGVSIMCLKTCLRKSLPDGKNSRRATRKYIHMHKVTRKEPKWKVCPTHKPPPLERACVAILWKRGADLGRLISVEHGRKKNPIHLLKTL